MALALAAAGCAAHPLADDGDFHGETIAEIDAEEPVPDRALSPAERALALYRAGFESELAGQREPAIELYRQAVALDPARGEYLARLGGALVILGRAEEGAALIARAEQLGLRSGGVYKTLALHHLKAGDKAKAAAEFERMLALYAEGGAAAAEISEADVLRAATFLVGHYRAGEKPAEGARVYGLLLRIFPDWAEFRLERARLLLAAGDAAEARREVAAYEKLAPASPAGARLLAIHFSRTGADAEALAEAERAVARLVSGGGKAAARDDLVTLRRFRAELLGRLGRFVEARQELDALRAAAADDGERVDLVIDLVWLDCRQGQPAAAVKRLREAIGTGLKSARLHGALAPLLADAGDRAGAVEAWRRAQEIAPQDNYYRMGLAALFARDGRRMEAAAELRAALSNSPDAAEALNMLGYLYAEEGISLEEAAALVERALKSDPDNGHYLDSLGWVRYRQGRVREALALLERAAMRAPGGAAYDHLGDALYALGYLRRARAAWQEALRLEPDRPGPRRKLARLVAGAKAAP